jgi:hypothetical protein
MAGRYQGRHVLISRTANSYMSRCFGNRAAGFGGPKKVVCPIGPFTTSTEASKRKGGGVFKAPRTVSRRG